MSKEISEGRGGESDRRLQTTDIILLAFFYFGAIERGMKAKAIYEACLPLLNASLIQITTHIDLMIKAGVIEQKYSRAAGVYYVPTALGMQRIYSLLNARNS